MNIPSLTLGSRRGFSILEILAVVAIIAVLAGLILPAISMVRRRARRVVALSEVKNIEAAWKKYFTEYNRWPTNLTEDIPCALIGNRARILEGEAVDDANNRRLPFVHFRKLDDDGNPVNAMWREGKLATNHYFYMKFDLNYDNGIPAGSLPYDPPETKLQRQVLIWTFDTSRNSDDPGFIIGSWQK